MRRLQGPCTPASVNVDGRKQVPLREVPPNRGRCSTAFPHRAHGQMWGHSRSGRTTKVWDDDRKVFPKCKINTNPAPSGNFTTCDPSVHDISNPLQHVWNATQNKAMSLVMEYQVLYSQQALQYQSNRTQDRMFGWFECFACFYVTLLHFSKPSPVLGTS